MSVKVTVDNTTALKKTLKDLANTRVLVGVPSATAGREDGPINNAAIGYVHEFGLPEKNIPARPFLVPGVKNARAGIVARLRQAGRAALDGNQKLLQKALMAAGLETVSKIQAKITEGPFAPLADSTLDARRRRGVTRTKPLIDTGRLRAAITYVIRKK